jgi:hypothetical protein
MNHLETLNEYIDSHFSGNKTEREARIAFQGYRDDVLTSIPTMDAEFIKEQPACVAMGFLGKMDFAEGANLERFIADPNLETLTVLRKNGVVRVADSARPAWQHLVTTDQDAACVVLELCTSTRKNRHVTAIKSHKTSSPKPPASLNS